MSNTLHTDRSARRAFSRDAARQFARPGINTATVPDVAAVVHGRHPLLHRIVTPKSGKLRINTKRNARAAFWTEERRTVLVRVSAQFEPHFRAGLAILGDRARIAGSTRIENWFALDLAVHIPGAPAQAVRAEPVLRNDWHDDHYEPVLVDMQWTDADGRTVTPS